MWIELHDNFDEISPILVNTDHIVNVMEDIIDKSGNVVTRLDTTDNDSIYVSESYAEVKEMLMKPQINWNLNF